MVDKWRTAGREFLSQFKYGLHAVKSMPMKFFLLRYPPKQRGLFEKTIHNQDVLDTRASSFLKREVSFQVDGITKSPRVIQGCQPIVTVHAGPSVVPATKHVKKLMHPEWEKSDFTNGRHIVYTSGYTTSQVGESLHNAISTIESMLLPGDRLVFIEDDQSKFDVHLTKGAFGYGHKLHRIFLSRKAARALRRTEKSKGRFPDGTKYRVPYTMQSGSPDTAFLDTLFNATMKTYIHGVDTMWYSIICGDDSLTVMPKSLYKWIVRNDTLINQYAEFGMETTVEIRYNKWDCEFCSSRFMFSESTAWMVPKPGRMLSKIFCDITPRNERDHLMWLRSVIHTLRAYANCDPLYAAIGNALWPGDGPSLPPDPTIYSHLPIYTGIPIDVVMYYHQHHYGTTPKEYQMLCDYLRSQRYGQLGDHPILNRYAVDANPKY
jgi:hypothetical protein